MEKLTMMINANWQDTPFKVHKTGCKDIAKDVRDGAHADPTEEMTRAEIFVEMNSDFIDDHGGEIGSNCWPVKYHPCTGKGLLYTAKDYHAETKEKEIK